MTPQSKNSTLRSAINALVLMCVIAATLGTIYLTYYQNPESATFFARSMNDASYDCEDKIRDRFSSSLISANFDQYSSRYDADDGEYIIYYQVTAQQIDKHDIPTIQNYMAKCTVWETLGYVSSFQVFDDF